MSTYSKAKVKIGVAITTHNRYDVFKKTYKEWQRYLPKGAVLHVIDDASEYKVPEATFRFDTNVGVAAAKTKSIELLMDEGCTHLALVDDDTYPISADWYKPYLASKEHHLQYIFTKFSTPDGQGHNLKDCVEIYRDKDIVGYSHVRGCFLWYTRAAIEAVGGFDPRYRVMGEHQDHSNRVHNVGLNTMRVMDVPNSNKLIHSSDEHREVASSIPAVDRASHLRRNKPLILLSKTSTEYFDYRTSKTAPRPTKKAPEQKPTRNVVLTSYFTGQVDSQRGYAWTPDYEQIVPLKESVEKHKQELVLLHNCFDLPNKVECTMDPYFNRVMRAYQYLRDHEEIDKVFMVDSTDVTMLNNPFPHMQPGKLYVGDEKEILGCRWVMQRTRTPLLRTFVARNSRQPLLNIGLIGGSREDVMLLLHSILSHYFDNIHANLVDMVVFNYVCYTKFKAKIVHGVGITNNIFKSYKPTESGTEFFLHK